jgi:lysozyme family protein
MSPEMTEQEMREIYWTYYWLPVRGDEFAYPLALAVFDTGREYGHGHGDKVAPTGG